MLYQHFKPSWKAHSGGWRICFNFQKDKFEVGAVFLTIQVFVNTFERKDAAGHEHRNTAPLDVLYLIISARENLASSDDINLGCILINPSICAKLTNWICDSFSLLLRSLDLILFGNNMCSKLFCIIPRFVVENRGKLSGICFVTVLCILNIWRGLVEHRNSARSCPVPVSTEASSSTSDLMPISWRIHGSCCKGFDDSVCTWFPLYLLCNI